jgi:hypothetical protein
MEIKLWTPPYAPDKSVLQTYKTEVLKFKESKVHMT